MPVFAHNFPAHNNLICHETFHYTYNSICHETVHCTYNLIFHETVLNSSPSVQVWREGGLKPFTIGLESRHVSKDSILLFVWLKRWKYSFGSVFNEGTVESNLSPID